MKMFKIPQTIRITSEKDNDVYIPISRCIQSYGRSVYTARIYGISIYTAPLRMALIVFIYNAETYPSRGEKIPSGGLAQLVERVLSMHKVLGSIPKSSTFWIFVGLRSQ